MKLPNLIGIAGTAGSGKDTLADQLVRQHEFDKRGFSDPLKAGIQAMFALTPNVWGSREYKETPLGGIGVSPRRLMQTLGTEWGRDAVDPDLWINVMRQHWDNMFSFYRGTPNLVIPDVRFDNEAEWIRSEGGSVILVERPYKNVEVETHSSEDGLLAANLDGVVYNNSDIITFLQNGIYTLRKLAGDTSADWHSV